MKRIHKTILALGAFALMAAPAMAQGGRGFGGGGGAMLLSNKGVQAELKVEESQKEKLNAFAQEMGQKQREAFQGLQDLSQEERREKMAEINKKSSAEIKKGLVDVLKPEQIKRFEQIQLQQAGTNAFSTPAVEAALKLTDEQKSKVRELNEATSAEMREIFQSAQDDREGAMKKLAELRKTSHEKATAMLTADQKKAWKELAGEPFEVKFEPRPARN